MRSADLLIGIMTCRANRARERAVRTTWLAAPPPPGVAVLFVEGDGDAGAPPRLVGDRLILPVPDAYELLPKKTHAFFRWAVANVSCNHILKCDDDSYLHIDVAAELDLNGVDYAGRLTPPAPGIVETWHFGKCKDRSFEVPFEGPFPDLFAEGFAYFVSRKAASRVADVDDTVIDQHVLEDVFVGWCLARDGGPPLVRADLGDRICARRAVWAPRPGTFARHPLAPDEMIEAHRRFALTGPEQSARTSVVGHHVVEDRACARGNEAE
ncbi:hypothetical protein KH5H1_37120 [Corallococcus caeni]|uniref:hypothetical protein n=1 Tax=Corallococcus caeni TaxID=3082388 RepID=UPI00295751EA|nr:hypothetical protein KH5H1_37120 [Corallococcus sp. KH5-1]